MQEYFLHHLTWVSSWIWCCREESLWIQRAREYAYSRQKLLTYSQQRQKDFLTQILELLDGIQFLFNLCFLAEQNSLPNHSVTLDLQEQRLGLIRKRISPLLCSLIEFILIEIMRLKRLPILDRLSTLKYARYWDIDLLLNLNNLINYKISYIIEWPLCCHFNIYNINMTRY